MLIDLIELDELIPPCRNTTVEIWRLDSEEVYQTFDGKLSIEISDLSFEVFKWTEVETSEEEKVLFNMHEEFDEEMPNHWEIDTVFIGTLNLFAFTIE